MIKKIDIAGIQLDNNTVRESILMIENMLSYNTFVTVEEVDLETVMIAKENEVVEDVLNSLEISVVADNGILDAVGKNNIQRKYEIESHLFSTELLKRVERNYRTVFLIGEIENDIENAISVIQEEFPKIKIVGKEALENCVGTIDTIINEINAVAADVIISVLPTPIQEQFLNDNRDKLSVNLWYGAGKNIFMNKKKNVMEKIKERIRIHRLEKHINDYEEQGVD